jgi:hypothetical protein
MRFGSHVDKPPHRLALPQGDFKRSSAIERMFRRIFSRLERLDVMFTAPVHFAEIADALRLR